MEAPPHTLQCKVCGSTDGHTSYVAREMMYGLRHTFDYFQCGHCETLQIREFPADMSPYYPSNYYSFKPYDGKKFKGLLGGLKRAQYRAAVFRHGLWQRFVTALFDVPDYRILKDLGPDSQSRILDVGCGNGRSFLYPLAAVGFQKVVGCDPYIDQPIDYPNGLHIHKASILEMKGQWDIITYHHSFEHVPNPLENLQAVERLLAPGGHCIIRIPTVSSHAWERYGVNWAQLDAPRHFFLHSRKGMKLLGEQAGLVLTGTVDDSRHFQFSGSDKYLADTALTAPRKKGLLRFLDRKWKKAQYTRLARQLNREGRGDQSAFFFQKPIV